MGPVILRETLASLLAALMCLQTKSELCILLQGVVGQGLHGLWQHLPQTGSRHTWPASSFISITNFSSSHNYFTLAGLRQVCQYLRNKYLRQMLLLSLLPILHGPQSDTVEYKVVPMEALQTTDTTTTRTGQCPPPFQEVESRSETATLSLHSRGAALWGSTPGEGRPPARTRCW